MPTFWENELDQIVRFFVTNLLLYMWCEGKKIDKPKKHKVHKQFWLLSMTKIFYILQIQSSLVISFPQKNNK